MNPSSQRPELTWTPSYAQKYDLMARGLRGAAQAPRRTSVSSLPPVCSMPIRGAARHVPGNLASWLRAKLMPDTALATACCSAHPAHRAERGRGWQWREAWLHGGSRWPPAGLRLQSCLSTPAAAAVRTCMYEVVHQYHVQHGARPQHRELGVVRRPGAPARQAMRGVARGEQLGMCNCPGSMSTCCCCCCCCCCCGDDGR
jgi:hypothetical protein